MSLKSKFSGIKKREDKIKGLGKDDIDKNSKSTVNPCLSTDTKELDSIANDSDVFEWNKYLATSAGPEVIDDYPNIEIDIVDHAISRLLLNFEISSSFIIKTDSCTAKRRLIELADFLSKVDRGGISEMELEAYSAEFVLNPTYTEVSFLVDGVRRYSSPFYRQLLAAGDQWGDEVKLKLIVIDQGHIVQLTFKHGKPKTKKEYVILNNLKGNQHEL